MQLSTDQLMPVQLPVPELPEPIVPPETGLIPGSPREIIFKAYIEGNGTEGPVELATRFRRPLPEVLEWFQDGHWVATRKKALAAIREHADLGFQGLIATERTKVAARHLASGESMEALIEEAIAGAKAGTLHDSKGNPIPVLSPGQLKTLAEALLTATSVRAKVVGITEKAAADAMAQAQAAMPQRMNLLVIGAGPIGPSQNPQPQGQANVIDVTSEEVK